MKPNILKPNFLSLILALVISPSVFAAADKPNMVVFIADDHGCADSSVYGSTDAKTPTMQKLANSGLVFDCAFVASPSCGPSRAALLSGLMPSRNGAEPNHVMPRSGTLTMVKQLQEQGYEVAAFGKVGHGQERIMAGFDESADYPGHNGATLKKLVEDFLEKRTSNSPLCLLVGDHRPHVTWSPESTYDPDTLTLPIGSIDTKETREHWARYLTDVTGMDFLMGEIDALARKHFGSDDYLFLYTSDHGPQWPFGKWNLYDRGTRTPMIVRWPGKIEAGSRTDSLVSWIDVMPTLIEIAGGTTAKEIDGRSFAGVLFGKSNAHRNVIYTTHSGDGNKNVFPIRAVRTVQFKYIRNLRPDCYHSNHSDIDRRMWAGAYWESWDEAAKTDAKAAEIVEKYYVRPSIEFFDVKSDPWEQNNLADDPQYAEKIEEMASMLDRWMLSQGDSQKVFNTPYPVTGPKPVNITAAKQSPQRKKKLR